MTAISGRYLVVWLWFRFVAAMVLAAAILLSPLLKFQFDVM